MSILHRGLMILMFVVMSRLVHAEEIPTIEIDFAKTAGKFRTLHGINKGTIAAGGLIDVGEPLKALGIPFARLHDCHWPNPDVVDIHAVFPDWNADPERPESYDFRLTDEYIAAIRKTGAQIIYRLGESIEHTSVKRYVHPPANPAKWAKIALGIIRHYNDGWANGFHYGIRYWEIWNEPENRPAMWTGTDEQYFELYRATAKAIKARFPDLKVGGPAVGYTGKFTNNAFEMSPFVLKFLSLCRDEKLPLDFFSWHCYTNDPTELVQRANAIRQQLNAHGFAKTESHLTEWNYLPDNDWAGLARDAAPKTRQTFYDRMAGNEGAAFLLSSLFHLQDAPVDVSCLFHGEVGGFGLFNENGVPGKNYAAVAAFAELTQSPLRVFVSASPEGNITAGAGWDATLRRARIIVINHSQTEAECRLTLKMLPIGKPKLASTDWLDADSAPAAKRSVTFVAPSALTLKLPAYSVVSLTLSE
jgi:xylan 1,4-beta-xylosidase